ncbi:MAG TPA: helix-hairpin-helix domain-containing protein [Puia sp.]|nr:helix-hairpin-helix domain-containing protein [Puia sp.]
MAIDNDYIAEQFSLLAKIMDIHGENSFKTKSYSNAAFTIEKLPESLLDLPPEKITAIKGIGDAIGKKIQEIIQTGELRLLREYIDKTPPGIIELLRIKGLGPKKIATIWKEMEIETMGELLYACQENRLLLYKGFGEKTQQNVRDAIEFFLKSQGSHLFAEIEVYANTIDGQLQHHFKQEQLSFTGEFRRQLEIIDQLQWVTTIHPEPLQQFLEAAGFTTVNPSSNTAPSSDISVSHFTGPENIALSFTHTHPDHFAATLLETSCSGEFLEHWQQTTQWDPHHTYLNEEEIFASVNIHFIPPYQREQKHILQKAAHGPLPAVIQPSDIRAIIHSHSKWSDGSNTLEEMAAACIEKGYEYLVISDHSKSAFYANGLHEDRIKEQHAQIDELNRKLAPFVIFKSVESDILYDGSLDYADNILATFDLVIASVHSILKMPEDKAMSRLIRAIENPYTTILGHMTGRLLLSRPGYPVDHKKIIDACAANKVVIELNAHPRRLDMDWRWISYALDKGVMISIDPDAHSTGGYKDVKYGVLAAQKGGLTPEKNLSSFTLHQFQQFLADIKGDR